MMMRRFFSIGLIMLVCFFASCSPEEEKVGEVISDYDEDIIYFLKEECGKNYKGELIYKIEYSYDKNGLEMNRVAADAQGREYDDLLERAYDKMGFEDSLFLSPEEMTGARIYTADFNYELIYDEYGRLKKAIPIYAVSSFSDSEVSTIEYTYIDLGIKKNQQSNSDSRETCSEELESEGETLREKLECSIDGLINVNGEMCHGIYGETVALVWKYEEATFDDEAHVLYAAAEDIAGIESAAGSSDSWDAFRYMEWTALYGAEDFQVYHIGDDIFAINGIYSFYSSYRQGFFEREYEYFINPRRRVTFSSSGLLLNEDDYFIRVTDFSDGYAICNYREYGFDKECYVATVDDLGNLNISDLRVYSSEEENMPCGIYSEGLFYYDWGFYDINFNLVIDLTGKDIGTPYVNQGLYTPHFVDGVCTMVVEKNGKYWKFDMNRDGEIISEVEEFDILLLNI